MNVFPILFSYRIEREIAELRKANAVGMVIALPWQMVIAHERQANKNHGQTVQRLAERGGLSACEACAVLEDRPWRAMSSPEAHARLKELFQLWVASDVTPA